MTKIKFEQEIHRVLCAFGLSSPSPLSIKHESITPESSGQPVESRPLHSLEFWLETETFLLRITRSLGAPAAHFSIILSVLPHHNPSKKRKFIRFTQSQVGQFLKAKNCPDYHSLFLHALSALGYDVLSLCDQAGIPLSNHQKIEFSLKYREANPPPNSPHD